MKHGHGSRICLRHGHGSATNFFKTTTWVQYGYDKYVYICVFVCPYIQYTTVDMGEKYAII